MPAGAASQQGASDHGASGRGAPEQGAPEQAFDREAAERILRRAIELADPGPGTSAASAVSEQALVEAAEELGVDPAVVRRASSEERLGLLEEGSGRGDALVGPAAVTVARLVDGPAVATLERADRWIRRSGGLRRRRLSADALVADYARRSDVAASLQRALRTVTGREDLGRIRRLRALAHPVGDDRCVLALGADLGAERTATIAAGSSIAGVGSTVSLVEAVTSTPWLWAGVPLSLAAGVGVMRVRARTVPEVELVLEGVLERVAGGDVPAGVISEVRSRLLGGLTRQEQ